MKRKEESVSLNREQKIAVVLGLGGLALATVVALKTLKTREQRMTPQVQAQANSPSAPETTEPRAANLQGQVQGQAQSQSQTQAQVQAPVQTQAQTESQTEKPASGCFVVSYSHERTRMHEDEEDCFHHRNLIRLKHETIDSRSLCVRVNGTPVRFQRDPKDSRDLIIGPVAGPDAKITAQYCVGKSSCKQDCTVARDEFLDAIGANASDGDEADDVKADVQLARWDSDGEKDANAEVSAKLQTEINREIAKVAVKAKKESTPSLALFKGWSGDSEETLQCGRSRGGGSGS